MIGRAEQNLLGSPASLSGGARVQAFVLSGCVLALGDAAWAQAGGVEAVLEAYAVVFDERGDEILAPADQVQAGQLIQYELAYKNDTQEDWSRFVVLGNVPDQTVFVSAGDIDDRRAVFEVQVPGIGWTMLPVTRYVQNEAGTLLPQNVPPREFEAIRWRLVDPVFPGEAITVAYRVQLRE